MSPLNIIVIAFFGLFTVALWPTYIPAIIVAPLWMRWVAAHRVFRTCPLPLLFGLSLSIGAMAGVCVLAFVIFLSWTDSAELALNWAAAGAVAGALTLSVICLIYRYAPQGD